MHEKQTNGHGEYGAGKIVLSLEYDAQTHQVSIGGTIMPLSLAQMICDEGVRVLAEQRRIVMLQLMQSAASERARTQGVLTNLTRRQ